MRQRTIKKELHFEGLGLHTGAFIQMSLYPAPINTGYQLRRKDKDGATIALYADNVVSTQRSTVIQKGDIKISTVEHVLSALYALKIDNCILEVDGEECPILTGNAEPYVKALQEVGFEEQDAERKYFIIKKRMEVSDPATGSRIVLLPDEEFSVDAHISFPSPVLSNQFALYTASTDYAEEIASSRSFVFVREILPLLQAGLIKGGDLSNALVIHDRELTSDERKVLEEQLGGAYQVPEELGYINPNSTMPNEPARHKILDLIGDLALSGAFIKGRVIAYCPGHKINNEMARMLRRTIKIMEDQAPVYDPNAPAVLDSNQIKKLLPHRYPFLLVDKIIDLHEKAIVGVKNVSSNEQFFNGHFPEEPVMPGVLIVEAMAQTGGLMILNSFADKKCSTYFLKINNVKFRQKVVPGDTLIFKVRLMRPLARGIAEMRGLAFVGEKLVCEAEFMAQIVVNDK